MSALDQKRTFCAAIGHVRFTPNSDRESGFPQKAMSCFTRKSGHVQRTSPCPLWAKSGHSETSETGRDEVRLDAGALDQQKFNELAAPIEAKHDAPWLRRSKDGNGVEEVRVVDLERGIERPATPDEIANGIEYGNYEHYKEGKAA